MCNKDHACCQEVILYRVSCLSKDLRFPVYTYLRVLPTPRLVLGCAKHNMRIKIGIICYYRNAEAYIVLLQIIFKHKKTEALMLSGPDCVHTSQFLTAIYSVISTK